MRKHDKAMKISLAIIIVILSWLSAWGIARTAETPKGLSDQAALLFGSSSIALFILSVMLAVLAVFGWQSVRDTIGQKVKESTQEQLSALETELRGRLTNLETELQGRVISVLGHTLGLLSTQPERFEPLDRERLKEAVQHCQNGYNLLEKVGGAAKFMALNNLVYYSCVYGDDSRSRYLLEQSRLLRDAGQEHNAPNLLLTYCRAILQYGSEQKEIREAQAIASALLRSEISEAQRREARFYLASLDAKLRSSPDGG